jgi:hypothetical protein
MKEPVTEITFSADKFRIIYDALGMYRNEIRDPKYQYEGFDLDATLNTVDEMVRTLLDTNSV